MLPGDVQKVWGEWLMSKKKKKIDFKRLNGRGNRSLKDGCLGRAAYVSSIK